MSNELTIIERDGEPTVWASDLADRIGMRRDNVAGFVQKHATELKEFGEIAYSLRRRVQATGFGNREIEAADWQLNEGQAAYMATHDEYATAHNPSGRVNVYPVEVLVAATAVLVREGKVAA